MPSLSRAIDTGCPPHRRFRTFLVEAGGRRLVVDTGTGNSTDRALIAEFDHQHRRFLADLAEAGFHPDTIDTVIGTHLHVDHGGWNTRLVDGRWIPTFPRARCLLGAADIDHWARSEDPLHTRAFADSVQPVIDARLVEPASIDTALTTEIKLRTTPAIRRDT